jgi:hypothetical protein
MATERKPGSTVRDEQVFRDATRFVWATPDRSPSPCPCKSKDCTDYHTDLMNYIATIKTQCVVPKNTIIGVSGMGHLSAQAHIVPERKDESRANGGAGKA